MGPNEARKLQWRQLFPTTTVRFTAVDSESRYFQAVTLRNAFKAKNETVERSAFGQLCEINLFRERVELENGVKMAPAAIAQEYETRSKRAECQDKVNESFVDMATTVWKRGKSLAPVLSVLTQHDAK